MRRLRPLLLAAALVAACKSDQEKLLDLRNELRTKLDALYSAYGGGALAEKTRSDAEEREADEGSATAARVVGELDRTWFEGYCLARGRGERPFNLSGKLEVFMSDRANEEACRDAAKLQLRIAELEGKLAR
jgi:hypothetical protein